MTAPPFHYREIARRHLDATFARMRDTNTPVPPGGWIRTLRDALGMTRSDLARRLEITEQAIKRSEAAESGGTIRLDTLARVAEALDAELVYTLIPRTPLEETVDARATALARREFDDADHTMDLEQQRPETRDTRAFERRVDELRRSNRLWRDP